MCTYYIFCTYIYTLMHIFNLTATQATQAKAHIAYKFMLLPSIAVSKLLNFPTANEKVSAIF